MMGLGWTFVSCSGAVSLARRVRPGPQQSRSSTRSGARAAVADGTAKQSVMSANPWACAHVDPTGSSTLHQALSRCTRQSGLIINRSEMTHRHPWARVPHGLHSSQLFPPRKWASSLGIEGNYTQDQMNYSRSYWFEFLPATRRSAKARPKLGLPSEVDIAAEALSLPMCQTGDGWCDRPDGTSRHDTLH
jgi:hypothetical protein